MLRFPDKWQGITKSNCDLHAIDAHACTRFRRHLTQLAAIRVTADAVPFDTGPVPPTGIMGRANRRLCRAVRIDSGWWRKSGVTVAIDSTLDVELCFIFVNKTQIESKKHP